MTSSCDSGDGAFIDIAFPSVGKPFRLLPSVRRRDRLTMRAVSPDRDDRADQCDYLPERIEDEKGAGHCRRDALQGVKQGEQLRQVDEKGRQHEDRYSCRDVPRRTASSTNAPRDEGSADDHSCQIDPLRGMACVRRKREAQDEEERNDCRESLAGTGPRNQTSHSQ